MPSAVKNGEVSEAEALTRLSRSPHWVWAAIDLVTKLLLAIAVGARRLVMVQCVVYQVVQMLAPDCGPVFLTDGFKEYITTLLTHFGHWIRPERRQATDPMPKPRWIPLPQLLYAQGLKVTRRWPLGEVKHRVVFGTKAAVERVLVGCGWQINRAFINFCLPHASVSQPLPQPASTNDNGLAKCWQPRTLAMAADLTDHVWTLRDVLLFRVLPWPQRQAV